MRILVMNGPNLNLLGQRQPDIYGTATLADIEAACKAEAEKLGQVLAFYQSNHEGALIDRLHDARGDMDGVVLNAGAYTHTSVALMDAIVGTGLPVVEVHMSNVHAREQYRHRSWISPVAIGQIAGFGPAVYPLALGALARYLGQEAI